MRNYSIERKTAETQITLALELDGSGKSEIKTGCGFFRPYVNVVYLSRRL